MELMDVGKLRVEPGEAFELNCGSVVVRLVVNTNKIEVRDILNNTVVDECHLGNCPYTRPQYRHLKVLKHKLEEWYQGLLRGSSLGDDSSELEFIAYSSDVDQDDNMTLGISVREEHTETT